MSDIQSVGHYTLLERIGSGGMGEVFRARDEKLKRIVAIKFLAREAVADPARRERFWNEARAASALNHPGIVTIHEIGESETDGRAYIVMEYVEGQSLRQALVAGPLPPDRALDLANQAADTLALAHEHGIVHRDLKPDNIMVSTAGYAKVLDFGLAKLTEPVAVGETRDALTEPGTVMGTAAYMSPEQVSGRSVDHRSDVFSFGLVLFEMFTGRPAFLGKTAVDLMHAILHQELPPLHTVNPALPAELSRIVETATHKDPNERFQSTRDLALELKRLKRETESGKQAGMPVPRKSYRRAFALVGAPGVVLLLVALLWKWGLLFPGAPRVLETAVREFPREIEPRQQLGMNRSLNWRAAESRPVLEEIVRLDDRRADAYNMLAYVYAEEGDTPRALASVDRYAALLPPNDPNPLDTRGDVLVINGRYEEALAAYGKNRELNPSFMGFLPAAKIALVQLHQGKYPLAEVSAESAYEKTKGTARAQAASVLGDIEVGRGRLDRAVARYEEAGRLLAAERPLMASGPLLKAAQIYFEQRQPEAVLALARRHTAAWAVGLRGAAHLLMKNDKTAEKEFAALRASLTPLVGEYMAGKQVEFQRLLASSYAGRWPQVIDGWPQLPRQLWPQFALDLGRAYLETGDLAEAERHLRFGLRAQRTWSFPELVVSHNFLAYTLAQFYLGKISERSGKKAEAINAYQEFLVHFQNSTARLPQIAEAQAALKRLM